MASFICGIEREMIQMNSLKKEKETHRFENEPMVTGGQGREKDGGKGLSGGLAGTDMSTLLYYG